MFNFNDIVVDVLLEEQPDQQNQGQPEPEQAQQTTTQSNINVGEFINKLKANNDSTFKDLLKTYLNVYGGQEAEILSILSKHLPTVTAQKSYFAGKTLDTVGGYSFLPFYDAFLSILDSIKQEKVNLPDLINFISDPNNTEAVNSAFTGAASRIAQTSSIDEYTPVNRLLINAKNVLDNQTNKLSQTAIQSLGSETVHNAVIKIIAKRVSMLNRVVGLKSLTKPFNASLITPILHQFKKYTGYKNGSVFKTNNWLNVKNWSKKVPGDFGQMVEGISADNLLHVAVLSFEYYMHLLRSKYLQQPQATESLNLFDNYFSNIVTEKGSTVGYTDSSYGDNYDSIYKNKKQGQSNDQEQSKEQEKKQSKKQLPILNDKQIEKIANQIGNSVDPDYQSFLSKGTSQFLPGTKYDLNTISKDPSKEAKALYKALTDMAYFVRQRWSLAQTMGKVATALGAVRVGMGPVG